MTRRRGSTKYNDMGADQHRTGYHKQKQMNGTTTPFKEPLLDWDTMRQAKLACEECPQFLHYLGGCRFKLLPCGHKQ